MEPAVQNVKTGLAYVAWQESTSATGKMESKGHATAVWSASGVNHMRRKKNLAPVPARDLFTAHEMRIVACSLLLRGQVSRTVSKITVDDGVRNSDMAQICLRQMARDLCRFTKEWANWGIDVAEIANRLRHVPDDRACRAFSRAMGYVDVVAKGLIGACATDAQIEFPL